MLKNSSECGCKDTNQTQRGTVDDTFSSAQCHRPKLKWHGSHVVVGRSIRGVFGSWNPECESKVRVFAHIELHIGVFPGAKWTRNFVGIGAIRSNSTEGVLAAFKGSMHGTKRNGVGSYTVYQGGRTA